MRLNCTVPSRRDLTIDDERYEPVKVLILSRVDPEYEAFEFLDHAMDDDPADYRVDYNEETQELKVRLLDVLSHLRLLNRRPRLSRPT